LSEGPGKLRVFRPGTVEYKAALDTQERLVRNRQLDQIEDTILLLEHPSVYTMGRGARESFLTDRTIEKAVHRVSRGGEVTYHGPGQLVGYPILKLFGGERDVHEYLRRIEQSMIDALAEFGIVAGRRRGLTGVWIDDRKIASIGVGIRRWVTLHGFALNVNTDLSFFDRIVPCGIAGCEMTSIAKEGWPEVTVDRFADAIAVSFGNVFGRDPVAGGVYELLAACGNDSPEEFAALSLS
jgi:lipoyl(octanoyl) transferase